MTPILLPMRSGRLAAILELIRWRARTLAEWADCDEKLVRRWLAGAAAIPDEVADPLERLAAAHAAIRPPRGWKTRP